MASNAEADWIEVPEVLHSPQTYEFIGFKEHVAREIWERFLNMPTGPNEFEADFLDMALAHIDGTSADALDMKETVVQTCDKPLQRQRLDLHTQFAFIANLEALEAIRQVEVLNQRKC